MSNKTKYISSDFEIFDSATALAEKEMQKRREMLENKNIPFIQFTKGIAPYLLTKMSKNAINIFMFMLDNMEMQDINTIAVSQGVIANELQISRQTVSKGIKELESLKVIAIGKVGQQNIYLINPEVAWMNGAKKKNTMKLKANVILGENENKELFSNFNSVERKSMQVQKTSIKTLKK